MDKPISMSVKDYLIRTLAVKMMMSEKTLEAVVNHQFQSANEAMTNSKSVEISGFGKFLFNDKKAVKKYEKLLKKKEMCEGVIASDLATDQKKAYTKIVLDGTMKDLEILKPKITYET
jgi:nucleoid DNA-binding protein